MEDGLSTDERGASARKLKVANRLHWQCAMEVVKIGVLPTLPPKKSWTGRLSICLNFSGLVLLPSPDGLLCSQATSSIRFSGCKKATQQLAQLHVYRLIFYLSF